jgi:coproporphyrinogen III oxidase-like Fe-S oxidoreductase
MEPFIGLGPSAASTIPCGAGVLRLTQPKDLGEYLQSHPMDGAHQEMIGREELETEYLMLGLRTEEGIDCARYQRLFGESIERRLGGRLTALEARGCLSLTREDNGRITHFRPTETGLDMLNPILLELMAGVPAVQMLTPQH